MRDSSTGQDWLERASADAAAARALLERGFPDHAAFHAQQAAEKSLKAVAIHLSGKLEKTHDLETLSREVKAPASIRDHASFLSPFYMGTRYPDAGGGATAVDAQEAITRAEEVLAWCRTQIS